MMSYSKVTCVPKQRHEELVCPPKRQPIKQFSCPPPAVHRVKYAPAELCSPVVRQKPCPPAPCPPVKYVPQQQQKQEPMICVATPTKTVKQQVYYTMPAQQQVQQQQQQQQQQTTYTCEPVIAACGPAVAASTGGLGVFIVVAAIVVVVLLIFFAFYFWNLSKAGSAVSNTINNVADDIRGDISNAASGASEQLAAAGRQVATAAAATTAAATAVGGAAVAGQQQQQRQQPHYGTINNNNNNGNIVAPTSPARTCAISNNATTADFNRIITSPPLTPSSQFVPWPQSSPQTQTQGARCNELKVVSYSEMQQIISAGIPIFVIFTMPGCQYSDAAREAMAAAAPEITKAACLEVNIANNKNANGVFPENVTSSPFVFFELPVPGPSRAVYDGPYNSASFVNFAKSNLP